MRGGSEREKGVVGDEGLVTGCNTSTRADCFWPIFVYYSGR